MMRFDARISWLFFYTLLGPVRYCTVRYNTVRTMYKVALYRPIRTSRNQSTFLWNDKIDALFTIECLFKNLSLCSKHFLIEIRPSIWKDFIVRKSYHTLITVLLNILNEKLFSTIICAITTGFKQIHDRNNINRLRKWV